MEIIAERCWIERTERGVFRVTIYRLANGTEQARRVLVSFE